MISSFYNNLYTRKSFNISHSSLFQDLPPSINHEPSLKIDAAHREQFSVGISTLHLQYVRDLVEVSKVPYTQHFFPVSYSSIYPLKGALGVAILQAYRCGCVYPCRKNTVVKGDANRITNNKSTLALRLHAPGTDGIITCSLPTLYSARFTKHTV